MFGTDGRYAVRLLENSSPRAPRDRRYDWADLFGAACPQRRVAAGLVLPAANAEAMSLHLAAIGSKVAPSSHAALVLDGAGYHIAAALTIPDNVTLIPLPPYAPELHGKCLAISARQQTRHHRLPRLRRHRR